MLFVDVTFNFYGFASTCAAQNIVDVHAAPRYSFYFTTRVLLYYTREPTNWQDGGAVRKSSELEQ